MPIAKAAADAIKLQFLVRVKAALRKAPIRRAAGHSLPAAKFVTANATAIPPFINTPKPPIKATANYAPPFPMPVPTAAEPDIPAVRSIPATNKTASGLVAIIKQPTRQRIINVRNKAVRAATAFAINALVRQAGQREVVRPAA